MVKSRQNNDKSSKGRTFAESANAEKSSRTYLYNEDTVVYRDGGLGEIRGDDDFPHVVLWLGEDGGLVLAAEARVQGDQLEPAGLEAQHGVLEELVVQGHDFLREKKKSESELETKAQQFFAI